MKKFIILLLTLALVVSTTACDTIPPDEETPSSEVETPSSDTETTDTSDSQDESQTSELPTTTQLVPGEIEGAIYHNPSIQLAMSIPGGWTYSTEQELLSMSKITSGTLTDALQNLEVGEFVVLSNAVNKITNENIIVSVLASDESFTEKAMADAIAQSDSSMEKMYISLGYTDIHSSVEPVRIGNEEHYAVLSSAMSTYSSMTYNDIFFICLGDYALNISINCNDENLRSDLLQNFYWGENAKADAVNNYTEVIATLGTTTDNTYTNESLGIGCTLPNGWTYYDRNTLMTANGLRTNLTEEELITALNAQSVYMDLYAYTANGDSLNIQVQKLDSTDLGYLNEQTCVAASIPSIKTLFPMMGYENIVITEEKFEILGRNHYGLKLNATIGGVSFYEKVACVQIDQYIVTITAANINEDLTEELLNSFYLLEE